MMILKLIKTDYYIILIIFILFSLILINSFIVPTDNDNEELKPQRFQDVENMSQLFYPIIIEGPINKTIFLDQGDYYITYKANNDGWAYFGNMKDHKKKIKLSPGVGFEDFTVRFSSDYFFDIQADCYILFVDKTMSVDLEYQKTNSLNLHLANYSLMIQNNDGDIHIKYNCSFESALDLTNMEYETLDSKKASTRGELIGIFNPNNDYIYLIIQGSQPQNITLYISFEPSVITITNKTCINISLIGIIIITALGYIIIRKKE